jgi:hypothetical protein
LDSHPSAAEQGGMHKSLAMFRIYRRLSATNDDGLRYLQEYGIVEMSGEEHEVIVV